MASGASDWTRSPGAADNPALLAVKPIRPTLALAVSALLTLLPASCRRPHAASQPPGAGVAAAKGAAEPAGDAGSQPELREAAGQDPEAAETAELAPGEALAAFDEAWQTVHDTHFDPAFNGVDWVALRDELRPRAERARTRAEVRAVIEDMLERLGQSHFAVIPSDVLPEAGAGAHDQAGGLGFDVRLREGRLLVVSLEPEGSAAAAGVQRGWSVRRIGAFDVEETLRPLRAAEEELGARGVALHLWGAARGRILGPVGERTTVRFLDAEDRELELELERRARAVTAHSVGPTLPTFYLEFASDILARGEQRIGRLAFSNWFLPVMKPLDEAVDRMRSCDGIVIDLRGNTGGAAAMTMGISGHFFAESTRLGTMLTRDTTLNILAVPRTVSPAGELVQPFAGALAILVDETTGSASEVFAGGLQAVGRARIVGETSAGAVLPAMTTRLPNGDSLLHAMGDFETAAGTRLEGRGVVPDEPVPLRRADLLAGRDAQMEAALEWLLTQAR